jgi:hypothetical protein
MSRTQVTIVYADEAVGPYTLHRRPVPRRGVLQLLPGQSAEGYGTKITTDILLKFRGDTTERRVYATCFSNAASHWVIHHGTKLWLRSHSQDEILD